MSKSKQNQLNNTFSVNTFSKGLYKDTDHLHSIEGTYNFALNASLESNRGDYGDIVTEQGNEACAAIPTGYEVIGNTVLDDNSKILYLASSFDNTSIIGKQTDCDFEIIIKSSCLNFDSCYFIDSIFRLKDGCESTLYFTDGNNAPYSINLDSLKDYYSDGITSTIEANLQDGWDCDRFQLFRDVKVPTISSATVNNTGGRLSVGAYQFAIRYLDRDLNPTNWFYISNPIKIVDEPYTADFHLIDGAINSAQGTDSTGDNAVGPTGKSIQLSIENIDTDYNFYQIAVVESISNIGNTTNVYKLSNQTINGDTSTYTYSGVNTNVDTIGTIEELIIPKIDISTAKHIDQIDNRLLLSNVTSKQVDYSVFQKAANQITSSYVVTKENKENINFKNSKSPIYTFDSQSYMRDEIYAFAVVFVFNDGSETPAFHIPGTVMDLVDGDVGNSQSGNTTHNRPKVVDTTKWDSEMVATDANSFGIYVCDATGENFCRELLTDLSGTFDLSYNLTEQDTNPGFYDDNYIINYTLNLPAGAVITGGNVLINSINNNVIAATDSIRITRPSLADQNDTSYRPIVTLQFDLELNSTCNYRSFITINLNGVSDSLPVNILNRNIDFQFTSYNVNNVPQPRYKVHNTAIRQSSSANYHSSGRMAYYETCTPYPDTLDCNGERIYPTGNIRHHKFPDTTLEPHSSPSFVYPMGIRFDNIVIPTQYANIIQGYYIVRADRDNINRTIIDKGLLDRCEELSLSSDNNEYFTYFRERTTTGRGWNVTDTATDKQSKSVKTFHSPKVYFNRQFLGASHYKIERTYVLEQSTYSRFDYSFNGGSTNKISYYKFDNEGAVPLNTEVNRFITDAAYVDAVLSSDDGPVGTTINGKEVRNYLGSNPIYFSDLENELPTDRFFYVSAKRYADVYNVLDGIRYKRIDQTLHTGTSAVVFGGDTYICRMIVSLQDFDSSRAVLDFYTESEINSSLRHSGGSQLDTYFNGEDPANNIGPWMTRYIGQQDYIDSGKNEASFVYPDPWFYNIDYSKNNVENRYFSLATNYDYCRKCQNIYPYRIHYSSQSFQEENVDHYRVFLTNNYADILGSHGEITDMFIDKDKLFVHSSKAIWNVLTKPNEVKTNETSAFLGVGEILSIPPKQLVSTDYGYGGSLDKWASVTTEYGTIFVDRMSSKVFILSDGLKEISQNGMRNWFENNLQINYDSEFMSLTNLQYTCYNTAKDNIGLMATYDPRYRRYILNKKDYSITQLLKDRYKGNLNTINDIVPGSIDTSVNSIYYIIDQRAFYIIDQDDPQLVYRELSFLNSEYFENTSWTISYNLMLKAWASFHSYMPNYMYNDNDTFYSIKSLYNNGLNNYSWKHNTGPYTTYYGTKFDFILDYTSNVNQASEKQFNSIQYISTVSSPSNDQIELELINTTFSEFYSYNLDQITATNRIASNLAPFAEVSNVLNVSQAKRTDNYWRISNNIRDIRINRNVLPIFSDSWGNLEYLSYYNVNNIGDGYIDRVPNATSRDLAKSVYERARMTGKWMNTRLFFKPSANYKLLMQFNMDKTSSRNR